jgi:hypothetical protein
MNDYYKLTTAQHARLKDNHQMYLFQRSLKDILKKWKVNSTEVMRLYELDFLSFEPQLDLCLEPIQEAELTFVLSLKHAGCDENMMPHVLNTLTKPYCYDREKMVYDFTQKKWLARLPVKDNELTIEGRIKQARQDKDVRTLRDIMQEASKALVHLAEEAIQAKAEDH